MIKQIPNYEGVYSVSDIGDVISHHRIFIRKDGKPMRVRERILKPCSTTGGYKMVILSDGSGTKAHKVHRLVAEVFLSNPDALPEVNHKNGVKNDNRLSNLEWCTRSENMEHAKNNNLTSKGERSGKTKFKNTDVVNIRSLHKERKFGVREIARKYGVAHATISEIIRRKTWKHI